MTPRTVRPPHLERLTERVLALDGPLIQLWAWPGAGQQAVLDALTEDARFGQPLSLDDLGDSRSLGRAVESAFEGGAHWLVLPAVPSLPAAPPKSAGAIARLLAPGQRLVFAAPERRSPGPLACSYLLPQEFLLGPGEVSDLWRGVTGAEPGDLLVDRLLAATDGWYRPLRLAAEAAAGQAGSVDPETLATLPSVASFLRHEVLGILASEERDVLAVLSAGADLGAELWNEVLEPDEEALRRRLVEVWGLGLEDASGLRLPRLLSWFLDRERRGSWPLRRRSELAGRLARAELSRGHPVRALHHLAEGDDAAARGRLARDRWPDLLVGAPLELLDRAYGPEDVAAGGAAAAFLGGLAGMLLWNRFASARRILAPVLDGEDVSPSLRAAARATLALLPGAAAPGPEDADWGALPAVLRPLQVVAEVTAAVDHPVVGAGEDEEEAPGDGSEVSEAASTADDRAAAAVLVPALERVDPGEPRRGGGGAPRGATARRVLFEQGLLELLRRRPGLTGELGRRDDLPAAWRRWLAGLPPAALASESSGYAVGLLGKPSVRLRRPGGRTVELRFPLRRALEVFAYLAVAPGFQASREELADAVWHDEGEETVEKNFHPTLSYVRKALGAGDAEVPPLQLRRGVYRLNPRLAWSVDVVELERRAEEGRRRLREGQPEQAASLWASAWGLYGGPFMAGWDAPWIGERRDRLIRVQLEVLADLGEVCERLGRLTEAMDALRAALIQDPLQERLHLALMRIYSRQGRRDLVRRQYGQLTTVLAEELGVEPLADTTEAYHRLMA